ncbi:radical SAM protein [candidate division WOR-3 bacterium]|nr:radical SAM protein [candidate division WOR-3 bacterium]
MKVAIIEPRRKRWDEKRAELWEFAYITRAFSHYRKKYSGFSLSLAILASLIPSDIELKIIDENVESIDFSEFFDLVIVTFFTIGATRAYEIGDAFRKKGIKVVFGGVHASMMPEEAILHADAVAIGEAEVLIPEIIEDCHHGHLKKFYRTPERPELENTPVPRWDLLKIDCYHNPTTQTMRGCPFDCEFCTVRAFWGKRYRYKPIPKVVEEIKILKRLFDKKDTFIMIADDDITANKMRAKDLFKAFIPLGIKWMGQGSLSMAKDDELLELMVRSGGTRMIIGFESISPIALREMHKNPANIVEEYAENVRKIQSYGVAVIGSFVVGFDDDDESVFERTANFIIENHIAIPQFLLLTPFPGTKLFERLSKEKRILHRDWTRYTTSTVCFKPKKMSVDTLQNGYYNALQRIFSYEGILNRLEGLWSLWDKSSVVPSIKEKIDTLVLNSNFRDVAYGFPHCINLDIEKETKAKRKLRGYFRELLRTRKN